MPLRPKLPPTERLIASGAPELSRRVVLRRLGAMAGLTAIGGSSALLGGCGGGGGGAMPPAPPRLGAHNLAHSVLGVPMDPISTASMTTQASGSTILACVGRGDKNHLRSLPTDNKSNSYSEQDSAHGLHTYTVFPNSGTALFASRLAMGGSGHVVSAANLDNSFFSGPDEVTLAVVEVINGGVIQDVRWNEVTLAMATPITSLNVTTTGPATLVAFWWGDNGTGPHTAMPNNGFTVIDSILAAGNLVQCAVATKDVSVAGSYNVTWTATPPQGAQMWLVAIQ